MRKKPTPVHEVMNPRNVNTCTGSAYFDGSQTGGKISTKQNDRKQQIL